MGSHEDKDRFATVPFVILFILAMIATPVNP